MFCVKSNVELLHAVTVFGGLKGTGVPRLIVVHTALCVELHPGLLAVTQ